MIRRYTILFATALAVVGLVNLAWSAPSQVSAVGATQISGIGRYANPGECTDPEAEYATYTLWLEGNLKGCHYVFVESSSCSPSGTYIETGTEIFVEAGDEDSTFMTTYKFEAKYQDCTQVVGEIFGRCQHPIVAGSGTGKYEGVSGRIDFKDDIEAGNFPYRGHLRY